MSGTPETWGDLLAQKIAKRIGPPALTASDLSTAAPAGMMAWVVSRGALYVRSKDLVWRRTSVTDPKWVSQLTWYIASTGSADADGASESTPTTLDEFLARIGNTPLSENITCYVLDSINADTLSWMGRTERDGVHAIVFSGVPTVVTTGTIASVQNWDPVADDEGLITGSASLVSHVGKLLRITGGAREGARFWIAKNTSGSTVRISCVEDGPYGYTPVDLQVGDPYEVLSLPHLSDMLTVSPVTDMLFQYLSIGQAEEPHTITLYGTAQFDACDLYGMDVHAGITSLYSCRIQDGFRVQSTGALYANGCLSSNVTIRTGGRAFLADHVVQDGRIGIEPKAALRIYDDLHSFISIHNYGAPCFVVEEGAFASLRGHLMGSGITGTPARIHVHDGGTLVVTSLPTIAGTGTALMVGGGPDDSGNLQSGEALAYADIPYFHTGSGASAILLGQTPVVSGGGGGGTGDGSVYSATFASYEDEDDNVLLTSTSTTTGIVTHNLTMPGSHARAISVTLSPHAVFVGPWVLTGTGADGNPITENLTIPGTGSTVVISAKCYAPGAVTLARPAQASGAGSYTVGIAAGFGLSAKAYGDAAMSHTGHIVSFKPEYSYYTGIVGEVKVYGPASAGAYGAVFFSPGTMAIFAGATFSLAYLGAA